jgi:hypothetical protein
VRPRAAGWLLLLVAAPIAIWHQTLGAVLASFRWNFTYVATELSPWLLFIAAIAFLIPVAVSDGRKPASRLYPRARRAYVAWGTSLYLLGCILAIEVTDIWSYMP